MTVSGNLPGHGVVIALTCILYPDTGTIHDPSATTRRRRVQTNAPIRGISSIAWGSRTGQGRHGVIPEKL